MTDMGIPLLSPEGEPHTAASEEEANNLIYGQGYELMAEAGFPADQIAGLVQGGVGAPDVASGGQSGRLLDIVVLLSPSGAAYTAESHEEANALMAQGYRHVATHEVEL